jgi:DNA ligase D-like protein (predicted polymerase)
VANKVEREVLDVAGREVSVSNPRKIYFPEAGITKLEVVQYYLAVAEGALRGSGGRPNVLVRYADGIHGEFFYQKRAPLSRPPWIEVVELSFPSGRTAEEVVPRDAAALAWIANLGCLELHPHPVRAEDLDHPDELRVDLDPMPGVEWPQIQAVARVVQEALGELGLVGWPKTSGSRGVHVNVRIQRRWSFPQVRRAALALARDVERRAPQLATSKWWKEERHGVFLDYNQNAKDRTVAGAYSVRPKPDARVSAPVTWDELYECRPEEFTLRTMPARFAAIGDRHAGIDDSPCSLDALLELSARQEAEGQGDAPWPPHYAKQAGEPPRVMPSRKKGAAKRASPTGRRASTKPLVEIGRAAKKQDALAGLERWKARHPEAAARLEPADVLVDGMRGRSSTWTRIRVNLEHVPEELRPPQEALDPDYDPWQGVSFPSAERPKRPAKG